MKKIKRFILGLTAFTVLALPTASNAVFVNLSGIGVDGGSPTVISVQDDEVLFDDFDIFYSFNIHHFWPSWGSETNISLYNFWIGNPGSSVQISGSGDCGFGNTSGAFSCSGSVSVVNPLILPGDTWQITLSDSFNDLFVYPDYVFGEGSYLAWGDDAPSASVPEPSTLLLLGAGIIGIGAIRMRKSKT
ncbi:MAG: PEP-CTERM sorting domain-containing protein [Candidatus Thiodiazotropha sp.]